MGKLDYESISENPIVQRYQELKKSVKFYQQKCKEKEKGTEIQYDNEEKCIYFPIGPNNI